MKEFEIIKKLVSFNTIKDKENEEILNYIEDYLIGLGFKTEIKTTNFITEASIVGDNVKRIILGVGPITAHEVNENITIESYKKLIKQYKKLIYEILG